MHYLITGGLGVIGSSFAKYVLEEGHQVTIIDACEEPRNIWMKEELEKHGGCRIIVGRMELVDIGLKIIVNEVDRILHAAAHTGIPHSANDPSDDWVSNVDATRVLLEALRLGKNKVPMVALSSVKPYKVDDIPVVEKETRYEWRNSSQGVNESYRLEPDEPYAASKMAQSALCIAYARTYDLPIVTLRCSNLYGAAPCHGPRHGWLTWFCISAVLERKIEIQGTGKQVRDMLFSDDVTSAILSSFEHMNSLAGNVYNIGGGSPNSVSCIEAAGHIMVYAPVGAIVGPGRKHEDLIFITDHSRFSKETGWFPKVGVKQGIYNIITWADSNKKKLQEIYTNVA